jgi:thiol-disulfide isomerase/thioredoxin
MKNLQSKLEVGANIAIIVVAILIVGLVIQRYFFANNQQPAANEPPTPAVGTKVSLPGVDFAQNPQTVLLVLQKGCHYCTDSAPFYQKLVKGTAGKNIKILAVLPQNKEESEGYLSELGIAGIETKQAPLSLLEVRGTPTVIVVNDKGEITNTWIGKLATEKELEVFRELKL